MYDGQCICAKVTRSEIFIIDSNKNFRDKTMNIV